MYFQRRVERVHSYGKYLLKFVSVLFSVTHPNLLDKMIGLLPLVSALQVGACSCLASCQLL